VAALTGIDENRWKCPLKKIEFYGAGAWRKIPQEDVEALKGLRATDPPR